MPLLSNAENVILNNSQLTDISFNSSPGPTGIDTLFEASIPDATHDSSTRDPPPRCLPGTHEQYIEDVTNWAIPGVGDTPLPLYWMKGPAGVGKSAVAQTCAEGLERRRKLGATFCFSTKRWSHNNEILSINRKMEHYRFFTSIAYQLSTVYPNYRDLLDTKIRNDRSLVNKRMVSQFRELIVRPLQKLEEKGLGIGGRVPVLVDGLDECESREAQREIVEIVAAATRDVPLCWAFFSRPEPHLEAIFSKSDISPLCDMAVLSAAHDVNRDIEVLPFVDQPDLLDFNTLLRAITAIISNRNRSGISGETNVAELDALYVLIMQRIPPKMLPIIHQVLAFLCIYSFSGAIMVANSLKISKVELEAACNEMSAVVRFHRQQEPLELDPAIDTSQSFLHTSSHLLMGVNPTISSSLGGSISFYHKSFKDFLLDPRRSGIYCVNTIIQFVVKRWEDFWRQRQDFLCWQGSKLVRAPGAPNSTSGLSYPYGNELVNSIVEAVTDYVVIGKSISAGADFDFRKQLYIKLTLTQTQLTDQETISTTLYNCAGFSKYIGKTQVDWLQPGEFPKFDVTSFKERIENLRKGNIIQPYHPVTHSLDKFHRRAESGQHTIGHGSKSIFWFWVIDYDLKTYRQFRSIDLAEGERAYREQFDSVMEE